MFAAIGVSLLLRGLPDAAIGLVGMGVLPIGALHWFAARGAKLGQRSARNISRVFATLFLLGFPFLTLLGIYMFTQTGKKWQGVT